MPRSVVDLVAPVAAALLATCGPWLTSGAATRSWAVSPPTCLGVPATIVGTSHHDTIRGTAGDDVIVGLGGVDEIDAGAGDDLVCGGRSGHLESDYGELITQSLFGGTGDDVLVGGRASDEIYGGSGQDTLRGRAGSDGLFGEDGADRAEGGAGNDLLDGGGGDDLLRGRRGADRFEDPAGDNQLIGGHGRDGFHSGAGNDSMAGGGGRDSVRYTSAPGDNAVSCDLEEVGDLGVNVDLTSGVGRGAAFGADEYTDVEDVLTGPGSDTVIGDDGDNVLSVESACGPGGAEVVDGGGGNDTLTYDYDRFVNSLVDRVLIDLRDGTGLAVGIGGPTVMTVSSIENVTGGSNMGVTLLGDKGPNVLRRARTTSSFGFGPAVLRGRGGNDTIFASRGAERLYGGFGADVLFAGRGDDLLDGGPGRNQSDGGPGSDVCRRPSRPPGAINCEIG